MLRREIVTPVHSQTTRLLLTALGCGVLGGAVAVMARPQPVAHVVHVQQAPIQTIAPDRPHAEASSDIHMVFRSGGAVYMKLGALEQNAMPKHGTLELIDRTDEDDYRTTAVGHVAEADVPDRNWLGKTVVVDGWCTAKVVGIDVVAHVTGSPDYAAEHATEWTAELVLKNGSPILAARLDGCPNGTFARSAELPAIVVPTAIEDDALAREARRKLLASTPAQKAQLEWEKIESTEENRADLWHASDIAEFDTKVVRHPTTGVTWVSVHAKAYEGCGGIDINLFGLYRVERGTLVAVQQRDLGELNSIKQLIDLEGDDELELIGAPWVATDKILTRASGEEIERLVVPFYGCPC